MYIDNFPGFLMDGGFAQDVSSILIGRPSKDFYVQEEKDLESTLIKLCDDYSQKLNCLTLIIEGHALAVEGTLKLKGKTFFMVRNPWMREVKMILILLQQKVINYWKRQNIQILIKTTMLKQEKHFYMQMILKHLL